MLNNFVNLRTHTNFSLSEGMLTSKYIGEFCKNNLQPACGISDTSNLFGVFEFSESLYSLGVQPIIGMQINVFDDYYKRSNEIILFAKNQIGYKNLVSINNQINDCVSLNPKRSINVDILSTYKQGLIVLSGGSENGFIGFHASQQNEKLVKERSLFLKKIFNNNFYIEIQRTNLYRDINAEPILLDIAHKLNVPIVATNDSYFKSRQDYESHEILIMIDKGLTVSADRTRFLSNENYLKTPEEMFELFYDLPEALTNTVMIAKRCSFMLEEKKPLLPSFANSKNVESEKELLSELSINGLKNRLADKCLDKSQNFNNYFDRLENELKIINNMGFSGYFLIVSDFVKWSKKQLIPVGPGRGSGAGSIVAWALEITDLDPIKWGLLFERFLNPDRVSMPDFDIDFCQDRRDEVISYIKKKYGEKHVAQIITFGSLQARAAIRDVGRVLEMPYGQVDRIAKMIPMIPANPITLSKALESEVELVKEKNRDEAVSKVIETALVIEGLNRHVSTHAAGIVISETPIGDSIPLYREKIEELPATQFDLKFIEKAGLVKFDILGLKTLSIIAQTEKLIKKENINFKVSEINLDDKKTFDELSKGNTVGIFQLESKGMQSALRGLKPDRFQDIIAVVALYRPGPMENIPSYINRKHGIEKVDYMHQHLTSILEETYGIFIYQEQVMQAAQILAGYTLSSADILRRAMGKKDKVEMEMQKQNFINGAKIKGLSAHNANEIFEQISAFAGYGFNKSHAAAYALIAYQCAWLKSHYPHEFFSSLMTYDSDNTDKIYDYISDLKRLSINFLSPDINESYNYFSVEKNIEKIKCIRCSLSSLKNVGNEAIKSMIKIRNVKGKFLDIDDFINKIPLNLLGKRGMESLTKCGAFEKIYLNRKKLFTSIPTMLLHSQKIIKDFENNQESLFKNISDIELSKSFPEMTDWSIYEKQSNELGSLGYYLNFHPLENFLNLFEKLKITSSNFFRKTHSVIKNKKFLKLAGLIKKIIKRKTQNGDIYAIVEILDHNGYLEVVFDEYNLEKLYEIYEKDQVYVFDVEIRIDNNFGFRLVSKRTQDFFELISKHSFDIELEIGDNKCLTFIKKFLNSFDNGKSKIFLTLATSKKVISLDINKKVMLKRDLIINFFQLPGINSVKFF